MAFFDWLRNLIEPNQKRPARRPRHAIQRPQRSLDSAPHEPTVTPAPSATPVTPPIQLTQNPDFYISEQPQALPQATLVIRLVDIHDQALQPALVLTGDLGSSVHFHFPEIPGYALWDIHGFTQDFISPYGLTTLIYDRCWGQPVISYLVDFDSGKLLQLPVIHRGRLDEGFALTPPDLADYHIFQAQGHQRGTFTDQSQQVVYFYRRKSWQTVQRVHQFVRLTIDHDVFDEPAGQLYDYQFPATSLWRLFGIITLTDGSVWYNLGGEQWLNAAETTTQDHRQTTLELPHRRNWQPQPFSQMGTVDYVPGKAVSYYQEPYGEVAGQLKHGTDLDIRVRIVDDQQLVWFQIGPDAYINARYVKLAPTKTI
ncbi:MucBP domain-containing protein [Levilactobacillus yonginensis]|uniref:MucBP domain-containing protein n=1 Tax=Levilactobacillus yonginensis TaxID=1054041 RepID=UPI000F77D86D|nr:MucBP domain-containing protein [Levilactobacillus yonginensis]